MDKKTLETTGIMYTAINQPKLNLKFPVVLALIAGLFVHRNRTDNTRTFISLFVYINDYYL